jgi:DNA polymerase-3 subunit beta
VRQAAIVTNDESRGVDFTFADGRLTMVARAADTGQSKVELPISYAGREISITLDPRFLVDFLRVLDPDKSIGLDIQDSDSAIVFTCDDGYRYVIMPLSRD